MALQDKLDEYKAGFKQRAPQAAQDAMAQATDDLRATGIVDRALGAGGVLPRFELKNQEGQIVRSDELLAKGPLVLSFFRGLWCPYCNIELNAMEEAADEFRAAGASVITISPQTVEYAAKTVAKNNLSYDILADIGNAYAKELGLVFPLPGNIVDIYQQFKLDLPAHNGDDSWTLPMPARYVIDQTGRVRYAAVDPDYTVRPDPQEALDALKALQSEAA